MSRKRRRSAVRRQTNSVALAPAKTQMQTEDVPRSVPLFETDAYQNRMAFLGEASELMQANEFARSNLSWNTEMLTAAYRENWIAKRIIDTPCEDMTRSWYTLSSSIDQEKIDQLAKLEAKHNIKQEIANGIRWARLYGGAAALIVIKGQEDMLDEPLDYDDLMPGCFRGLMIIDKASGLDPSIELEEDMDDPEYNYPKYYYVELNDNQSSTLKVHHSRLITFRGRQLPLLEEQYENYWGAPELEHVYDELQKRNSTSANIAQMVFQANITVTKMADYGEVIGMGTERQRQQILRTIYEQNRIKTAYGTMIMGKDDQYEQHAYNFGGLKDIYELFMMDMAGAAEIPATKLYGRAPQGMNATGESDMKNYYEKIAQLQETTLRPALEKLLPIMAMSLWGEIPEDMEIVFNPVATMTPTERASIMSQYASTISQMYTGGIISRKRALMELKTVGKEIGAWTSITQDFIDAAEDEVDQGEMGGGPMDAMMGGGGDEGGSPEAMAALMGGEEPEEAAQGVQEAPEDASESQEKEVEAEPEDAPEEAKKASMIEMLKSKMKEKVK